MKTPDTQMHHLLSAAAVTDCARTPIFAEERGELLREVTPQPACPQAVPGHHDQPQLGSTTTTEGEMKTLPCSAHLVRRGAVCWWRLAGSTAPYDGSHTERHLRYRETLFQLSWRDQPSQWFVRMAQAVFHSTGSAGVLQGQAGWPRTFLAYD